MALTVATTLGVLVQAEPALAPICALKLAATSAYHVAKLARLVAQETAHVTSTRHRHIKELGTERADGSISIVPDDSGALTEFVRRMEELAAVPVTIPWGPITLAMLGDEKVSAADLQALGPLLAEPDPEGPP